MKKARRTFPIKVTVYVRPKDEPTWKRAKRLSDRSSVHSLSSLVSDGLALILDRLENDPKHKPFPAMDMQAEFRHLRDEIEAMKRFCQMPDGVVNKPIRIICR